MNKILIEGLLKLAYEYGGEILNTIAHNNISYQLLTEMQIGLIKLINCFKDFDKCEKIINYLTDILNILSSTFFDQITI